MSFFCFQKGGKGRKCQTLFITVGMLKEKLLVKRIINNNIVIAENFSGQELVAIGKGLGFRKNICDVILPNEVQKKYVLLNHSNYIFQTLEQIPFEIIEITEKIIDVAQCELHNVFSVNLVVALADHINFSIHQYRSGLEAPVLENEEIKRFYKEEYAIGKKAIEIINETLQVHLMKEEATAIAFHLIVATEKRSNRDSVKIMKGVGKMIGMIEATLQIHLDEDSNTYARLVIHLKYFIRSILFEQVKSTNDHLQGILAPLEKFNPEAVRCVEKISEYVMEHYKYNMMNEDRLYLLIHIIRVLELFKP